MYNLITELEMKLRHLFDRTRFYDDYPKTKEEVEEQIKLLLSITEDIKREYRLEWSRK